MEQNEKKIQYLRPEDILTKSYLYELRCMGLTTDEQIEHFVKADLESKGLVFDI